VVETSILSQVEEGFGGGNYVDDEVNPSVAVALQEPEPASDLTQLSEIHQNPYYTVSWKSGHDWEDYVDEVLTAYGWDENEVLATARTYANVPLDIARTRETVPEPQNWIQLGNDGVLAEWTTLDQSASDVG